MKSPRIRRRSGFRADAGYGKTQTAFEIYKQAMVASMGKPFDPSEWLIMDLRACPSVPHSDNPYFVYAVSKTYWRSSYFDDLLERLGRERYVQTGDAIYARDDEALAMWTLAFDEIEAEKSNLEHSLIIQ